jgi:Lrp/AsnC family leucine-responsive transcriptional regulator
VFEQAVLRIPEVLACYLITGEYDYLVRVVVADPADFARIHSQHLIRLAGVIHVHSSFAPPKVQEFFALPVPSLPRHSVTTLIYIGF